MIATNPGLQSRFTRTIHFPDYTTEELVAIFESMSAKSSYHLDEGGALRLAEVIHAEPRTRGFGNARFVRNVFEAAVSRQAERLATVEAPTDEQLTTLTADDVAAADMNRRAWILFGLMGAIWGVPYLFIKVAVEHMAPPVVVFGRTAIAVVPLLIVATRAGAIRPALARWRPLLAFATLEMAIPWFLLTDAERHLPSGLTGLLIACVPIVGAVVAFAARRPHTPSRRGALAGIALGLGGVTLLVAADLSGEAPWWSIVEVLLVCVGYATAPFIASRRLADVPDVGVVALSLSAVAIVYAPIALATWPDETPPARRRRSPSSPSASSARRSPSSLFFRLIAAVGPARSTLITFVNPAVAVAVGAIFLDEEITATTVGGFALVLVRLLAGDPPGHRGRPADAPELPYPARSGRSPLTVGAGGSAGVGAGAAGVARGPLLAALGQQGGGLVADGRHEHGRDEVDEVAREQALGLVRSLAGAAAELDVGEAHRRVAPVQRRADDDRRQQRPDERAPAGDRVPRVVAHRVRQDRHLVGLDRPASPG